MFYRPSYRKYGRRSFRKYAKKNYVSKAVKKYVSKAIVAKKEFHKVANNTNPTIFATPAFEYFVELTVSDFDGNTTLEDYRLISMGGTLQFNNDTANACLFRVVILKTTDYDESVNTYDDIFDASVTTRLADGINVQDDLTNVYRIVYDKYVSIPATNIERSYAVRRYKIRCNDIMKSNSYGGSVQNARYIMCVGCTASSANVKLTQWRVTQEV